jgi:hypothetical protein
MTMKRGLIGVTSFLLVLLLLTLYIAFAADSGSRENPLVSLDYLESLTPAMENSIDAAINAKVNAMTGELTAIVNSAKRDIDNKVAGMIEGSEGFDINNPVFIEAVAEVVMAKIAEQGTVASDASALWRRVDLEPGQTVRGQIGMEAVLRLGSATAVAASNPAMVSFTDSSSLNNGTALKTNHLYFVTINGNGFKAGNARTTVFIRGSYTIE